MEKMTGLCMGCMSPLEGGSSVCSRCSYDNAIPNPRGALPSGTLLDGRYLLGRVIRHSDLTITYLALSTEKNVKVYVEEFFPVPLVTRDRDGCTLNISEDNRIRYKTLFSDMADRWRRIAKLESRCVMKVRELVQDFGTVYCVMAYLPYDTLEQQLEERGAYSWAEAKAAFMPLFSLCSNLHNQGLTHCGISPENIIVNRRGELVLTGFSLPELRTEGSGLSPELYAGYSAPEQYSKNMWQGEWTDVYALGAVLYRALTSATPLPAPERVRKDQLPEAAAVDPSIPDHVSEALYKAMAPEKTKRYPSVDEFSAALLKETVSNTAVFRPEPVARPEGAAAPRPKPWQALSNLHLSRTTILVALLSVSLVINLVLAATGAGGRTPPEPSSESISQEPESVVELMEQQLVGVYIKQVQDNPEQYGNLVIKPEYNYNEDYPENIVYAQSVQVGEPMPADRTITLSVSRGSQYIIMPYLRGSSMNFASKTLTDLNVSFEFEYDYNPETSGIVGTVIDDNKGFGARIARGSELVILTIKGDPANAPSVPVE